MQTDVMDATLITQPENMERLTKQVVLMLEEIKSAQVRRLGAESTRDEAKWIATARCSNDMATLQGRLDNGVQDRLLQGSGRQDESGGVEVAVGGRSLEPTAATVHENWVMGSNFSRHSTIQLASSRNPPISAVVKDSRIGFDDVSALGEIWRLKSTLVLNSIEHFLETYRETRNALVCLLDSKATPLAGISIETTKPSGEAWTTLRASVLSQANKRSMQLHAERTSTIKTTSEGLVLPWMKNGHIAAIT